MGKQAVEYPYNRILSSSKNKRIADSSIMGESQNNNVGERIKRACIVGFHKRTNIMTRGSGCRRGVVCVHYFYCSDGLMSLYLCQTHIYV